MYIECCFVIGANLRVMIGTLMTALRAVGFSIINFYTPFTALNDTSFGMIKLSAYICRRPEIIVI